MPRFEAPDWSAQPQQQGSLVSQGKATRVDERACYVIGRDKATVDVHLDDESVSRHHAAIVHHKEGKVYIIDLDSAHGTYVNGSQLDKNKPTKLHGAEKLTFGAHETNYFVSSSGQGGSRMYQAMHLLVKHKDVRNPKSWKEPVVTRTEEEALAMIEGFHANLVTGDPDTLQQRFADLATSESHCSSAKRGGDLGQFGPGQMMKAFEEAVADLRVENVVEAHKGPFKSLLGAEAAGICLPALAPHARDTWRVVHERLRASTVFGSSDAR